MRRTTVVSVIIAVLLAIGCVGSLEAKKTSSSSPSDLKALLKANRGQVLILLVGTDGCPGTTDATKGLDAYIASKPKRVSVVRIDVPLPNQKKSSASPWKHKFPRYNDKNRKIADQLEFFYYPTLFVFDGQGVKRYVGAYNKNKIAAMAREILAEKPGAKKKIYTPVMPAIGKAAPVFSGKDITGRDMTQSSLKKKRGLLIIFSRTSCPFSAAEIPQFKDLAKRYSSKGVGVVVVNQQESLETIKPIYKKKCAGVPVIWDKNGKICKSYGVDAVPFFFLLDGNGKVVARRSFTHPAAVNTINAMLGLKSEKPRYEATPGG